VPRLRRAVFGPARRAVTVARTVIDELRVREKGGYVALPEPRGFRPGDPVRFTAGLMAGALGLYAGQRSGERVAVLVAVLGRVVLPADDVAPA
jgi:hypothetical protein